MSGLVTTRNLTDPDATYAHLIAAHEGRTDDQSAAFNARLILILMNHIGDPEVLADAIEVAGRSAG